MAKYCWYHLSMKIDSCRNRKALKFLFCSAPKDRKKTEKKKDFSFFWTCQNALLFLMTFRPEARWPHLPQTPLCAHWSVNCLPFILIVVLTLSHSHLHFKTVTGKGRKGYYLCVCNRLRNCWLSILHGNSRRSSMSKAAISLTLMIVLPHISHLVLCATSS